MVEPVSVFRAANESPQRDRLTLDNSLRRWFSRNVGLWRSRRIYFFEDDEACRVDMMLRVEAFSEPVEGASKLRCFRSR